MPHLRTRLGDWLTMVQRGEVLNAYRSFIGLMEDKPNRDTVLAELAFAGLIDVQDRMYRNRSYTTGHKAYRARATIELGNALGWDNAHNVVYAGALDIAVGPRWHSLYEMACNTVKEEIEGVALHAVPYGGVSEAEQAILRNTASPSAEEEFALLRALLHEHSPANLDCVTMMLKAGMDPRRIVDVIQIAAAEIVLGTHGVNNFSMPMHCYEYTNALGWFYDTFDHPRRLRLLYIAAEFVNMTAWHQKLTNAFAPAADSSTRRRGKTRCQRLLRRGSTPRSAPWMDPQAWPGSRPIATMSASAPLWSARWHWRPANSATIRITRKFPRTCWRISARTRARAVTDCCSPARSIAPRTGNTAIRSRLPNASARRWGSHWFSRPGASRYGAVAATSAW